MFLVEESAPAVEALPIAGLRDHLRIGSGFALADDPAEDAALAGFLRAAIATIEARTGKVLLTRRFTLRLDDWRDAQSQPLPLAPVLSVDGVRIDDGRGNVAEVDPARYRLVPDGQRPRLEAAGTFLPAIPRRGFVVVTFTAGFGADWAGVPPDLAQAVLLLAARYHEDRSFEGTVAAMPQGVAALIERWRAVRVLGGRGASGVRR